MWDEMAESYPLDSSRCSVQKVVSIARGMADRRRALDIGCGPGNMTIPLAEIFDEVTAADSSARMLERLGRECGSRGLTNVSTIEGDCMTLKPEGMYDLVVTCLCPGMYSEEAVDMMSSLSDGKCVYIGPTYRDDVSERRILEGLGFEFHPFFETGDLIEHLSDSYDVGVTCISDSRSFPGRESFIDRCIRMAHTDDEGAKRITDHIMGLSDDELPRNRSLLCLEWSP